MYLWASATLSAAADPATFSLGGMLIGAALLWTPWARLGRWLTAVGGLMVFAMVGLPISSWLTANLENRYSVPSPMPVRVDGIIVLGGSVSPGLTARRNQPILNDNSERLIAFVELARTYPDARLVFTGGGKGGTRVRTEAAISADVVAALGIDAARVTYEDRSTNTYENAVFLKGIVQPEAAQTWLLITSAWHMPRAVASFQAVDWRVIPYPVDYRTGGSPGWGIGLVPTRLVDLRTALHEWVGLMVYRIMGRTSAVLPAAADVTIRD